MRSKTTVVALILVAALAWPCASVASAGYYLRVDAAYSQIEDADVDFKPAGSGGTIAGEYEFDDTGGSRFGLGYRWTPRLRLEISLGWLADAEAAGPGSASPPPSPPAPAAVYLYRTQLAVRTIMASLYFDLLPAGSRWRPYIGLGAGYAHLEVEDTTVTGPGFSGNINGDSSDEFAWRVEAGIAVQLSERLALGLAYAWLDAGNAQSSINGSVSGAPPMQLLAEPSQFDVEMHQVLLSLTLLLD